MILHGCMDLSKLYFLLSANYNVQLLSFSCLKGDVLLSRLSFDYVCCCCCIRVLFGYSLHFYIFVFSFLAFGWTAFDLYRTSYIFLHLSFVYTPWQVFFCISLIKMYIFLIFGVFLSLGPSWTTFDLCLCWQAKNFF